MKKNMGETDNTIRIMIAAFIAILYSGEIITGTFGVVLLVLAALLVLTGLLSFCPVYAVIGKDTGAKKV